MKKALFAGSFDPITLAHLNIIEKSKNICDHLTIAVAKNSRKESSLFSNKEKIQLIESATKHLSSLTVVTIDELTTSYAKKNNIDFLIRGISTSTHIPYELSMASTNRHLSGIETVFILSDEKYSFISSTQIRELASYGHSLHGLVPEIIEKQVLSKFSTKNSKE